MIGEQVRSLRGALVLTLRYSGGAAATPALALALLSIIQGLAALLSACFLAGMLAGFRSRWPAAVAILLAICLQWATSLQHFRLESLSPLISVILAPLTVHFLRLRSGVGIVTALLIANMALLVAMERGLFAPGTIPTITLVTLTAIIGLIFGMLLDTVLRRDAAWSRANIALVARDLLLGRITTGMIHDLAQPINVVSMANGNLSYLLNNMPDKEHAHELLQERIERIAGQTDKAANLLHNFRSFGRGDDEANGVLTVRDALERTRIATTSNVRHGGVTVEFRGNALDCICGEHLAVLQLAVAGALLSAFAAYTGPDGERRDGSVIVDATLGLNSIIVTVNPHDAHGKTLVPGQPEPALVWLLQEVLASNGGRLTLGGSRRLDVLMTIALPHRH